MERGHRQLVDTGLQIIAQLKDLALKITPEQYTAELDILHANSIGKHMRHVAEFFDLLVRTAPPGPLNYDRRHRNAALETDPQAMLAQLAQIASGISALETGAPLDFEQSYAETEAAEIRIRSTVARELSYNIEHAIHHMAIIKIAVATVFPAISLDRSFGVAYSTWRHQKNQAS